MLQLVKKFLTIDSLFLYMESNSTIFSFLISYIFPNPFKPPAVKLTREPNLYKLWREKARNLATRISKSVQLQEKMSKTEI